MIPLVSGDPATLMIELSKGLKGYICQTDWLDKLKERDIDKEKANRYLSIIPDSITEYVLWKQVAFRKVN